MITASGILMGSLTSRKPYLVRAINDWILDNGLTPFISVDTRVEGVVVPPAYIEDDEIVLNINPSSVRNLEIGNEYIFFSARFSGQHFAVEVPVSAVQAVYARENGEGMLFAVETDIGTPEDQGPDDTPPPAGRPSLKIVK